jgi:hypothetical protein
MSLEDLAAAAQYEDLCNQEHVVKLMLLGREEFWRNKIGKLETLIIFSADRKQPLLKQIKSYRLCRRFGGSRRSSGISTCGLFGFDRRLLPSLPQSEKAQLRRGTHCHQVHIYVNGPAAHRGSASHVQTTSLTIL